MSITCRALAVLAVVAGLSGVALCQVGGTAAPPKPGARPLIVAQKRAVIAAPVQPPPPGGNPADPSQDMFSEGVTLPTDRRTKTEISSAQDLIRDGEWTKAATVLQSLLDRKEDLFLEVQRKGRDGQETSAWTSVRAEANRLLGTMPADGLQIYELRFGNRAKALLNDAKAASNTQLIAEVALKYLHTEAGAEATNILGTYYLDRGSYVMAALCFERLLGRQDAAKLSPLSLFKAALAFQRAGDKNNAERAWTRLSDAASRDGGLRIGDQLVNLDQARAEMDRSVFVPVTTNVSDWPLLRGSPSRSAQGNGNAPYLDDAKVTIELATGDTQDALKNAVETQLNLRKPVIPGSTPLAMTVQVEGSPKSIILFRSYDALCAYDVRTGERFWESMERGILGTLGELFRDPAKKAQIMQSQGMPQGAWLQAYQAGGYQNILYENTTLGTLSADDRLVYTIDDLAIPPPQQIQMWGWGQQPNFGPLTDLVNGNKLLAYELDTGKLQWYAGGHEDKNDLADSFFLGVPLPIGGKLYVLNERKSEIRLLCLDPLKKGAVLWSQTLANTRNGGLAQDITRRVEAANLAYSDGILVCPTNAGAVLGVDLLSRTLVWAHSYRQGQAPAENEMFRRGVPWGVQMRQPTSPEWHACVPIIKDGKVVFTAPDGDSVQCLNLRDGSLLWSARRRNDVYVGGVYGDKVLLVGNPNCRALALANGKQLWELSNVGTPSGVGVAGKDSYYLPLRSGQNKEPEVCAVDIERGVIQGHSRSRKKSDGKSESKMEIPGNLVFFEGNVLSQGVDAVKVFPQLDAKLAQISERLKQNPNDPIGLTERGEMQLDRGHLKEAAEDLRRALENHPPAEYLAKTRLKLYDTLTELFQRDFEGSEKYLHEYEEMCKVDIPKNALPEEVQKLQDEQRRRQGNLLCLLGKGREKQGRLVEAFDAYMKYGTLNGNKQMVSVVDQPAVQARPDVWAQGRIDDMLKKATPEQRRPLEAQITTEWEKVRGGDTEALRHFVALFGSIFEAGKKARLELAERLIDDNVFLEAEMQLHILRDQADRPMAGRAVEALARLMIRKGLMEDAAYFYRLLGRDYADVLIKDGKTGSDFYNELATDKRFLPFLDDLQSIWGGGKIKAKQEPGGFNYQQQDELAIDSTALPFFQRYAMSIFQNPSRNNKYEFKIIDRSTNQERWSHELDGPVNPNNNVVIWNNGMLVNANRARAPFHIEGHLVVLHHGSSLYAIDPVDRKLLWEKSLQNNVFASESQNFPLNMNGGMAISSDGYAMTTGRTGPMEASYICAFTKQGLVTLDPLQGTELWRRSDISGQNDAFGDDEHIYLVEMRDGGTTASAARALRARDGVSVPVPDFAALYQKRLRIVGRDLLLADAESEGKTVLRLYDVATGKDVWRHEFAPRSRVIHTEEPNLTGIIEPRNGGKVTVLDLHSGQELLVTRLLPKDAREVDVNEQSGHGVHLLQDRELYYLVFNNLSQPAAPGNFQQMMGMNAPHNLRPLSANGNVYAFERSTGKLRWRNELVNQSIVLDHFNDLPVLICTPRFQDAMMNRLNNGPAPSTKSFDKRTGKLVYDGRDNGQMQFYSVNVDLRAKTVDLLGGGIKLHYYLEPEVTRSTSAKPKDK